MPFNTEEFVKRYISNTTGLTGTTSLPVGNIETTPKSKPKGEFDVNEFVNRYIPPVQPKGKLDTSDELYSIAVQSGLKKEADKILAQKGEKVKQIFSGGFISDIFDALNALQYGVVGMLKGKGFMEGVRTRQSFADKDALGDKGLPGIIGGIVLDIAADPLTYLAPWTVLKKIGVVEKLKPVVKIAEESKIGQWLGRNFIYRFGQDPIYAETAERSIKNIAVSNNNIKKLIEPIIDIPKEKAAKLLTRDETGRFIRTPLEKLRDILTEDELFNVAKAYSVLDDLGKQAVEAGLLSKGKWEENLGEYIKNAYLEYEKKKSSGVFGFMKKGIFGIKPRKPGLTQEEMLKLGQIDNPSYLLFKSMTDLVHDIENAKLFKEVAKRWAKDTAEEGFEQLPETARLITTAGKRAELATEIKQINQNLRPIFRQLQQTFRADRKTLSLIRNTEKEISRLASLEAEKLTEFFQAGQEITKITKETRRLGTLPEDLISIAQKVKRFDNLESLIKSDVGIEVEKLWREGILERRGFSSIKDFFNYVKEPFVKIPAKETKVTAKENLQRIIELQKNIEQLSLKARNLREIDKRSINDAFRFLEDRINILTGKKEELKEEFAKLIYGDLAGKYVPKPIYDDIQEMTRARSEIEKGLGKVVAGFKFGKVILNPSTHARNVMSNQILNWWKVGMNPLSPKTIDAQITAFKELARPDKWVKEASSVGFGLNTYAAQEIKDLLLSPEGVSALGKFGKRAKQLTERIANIYQGEENFAKLSAYIFNRKYKKMGIEEAWKAAESATFNYSQVTPFVRRLRESIWGYPFITFSLKATPVAVETALKTPRRISVFGKIKNSIEQAADIKETERERASEPSWIKDGFYIKLPIKDKYGRSAYFDLTYIIPFGDLMSGQFFERAVSRETGMPEGLPSAAMRKLPFVNVIRELSRNQDFYGDKIWKESDPTEKQLGDIMNYLVRFYSPPLIADQLPGGYMSSGERRIRGIRGALTPEEQIKQKRTLMQEMLRNVGLKVQPIDADIQETYMEWEKRKALETLLQERGILKRSETTYKPKKK